MKAQCGWKSERLAGARGQAARERGLASLCESGRERMVERAGKRCGRVCRSWGAFWGWVRESVVCGGVGSGRAGTGYEVGGWGERHGALGVV